MITSVKLVDGSNEFVFQDNSLGNADEVVWTKLDTGSPEIRSSVSPRISMDGTTDRSMYHGSRSVALECRVASAPAAKVDHLNTFLHPKKRPYLVVRDTDWAPVETRRMMLRSDQWSTDLINTSSWFRDLQLQWTAPRGVWESFDLLSYEVDLSTGAIGRTYPMTGPRVYPPTGSAGVIQFENPGNGQADWVARLYGPCVGPRLTNESTGDAVVFKPGFALAANQYIEISSADLTVYANGNPTLSRTHQLSFSQSTWFTIDSGLNKIRYNPASGVDDGCRAEFEFRPTWI